MKKILLVAIAMMFSAKVFGESKVRQVYRLSTELATVNTQLELAKSDRSSQITKIVISTTAAVALGLLSRKFLQAKGGDISGPINVFLGIGGSIATAGVVGYDGYQAYQLSISSNLISTLQKSVAEKQAQLELVIKANDDANQALQEMSK